MISTMKTAALAGVLALAAGSASAVTIAPGQSYSGFAGLTEGTYVSFLVEVEEDVTITSFAISGQTTNGADNLGLVKFGLTDASYNPAPAATYSTTQTISNFTFAEGSLSGGTFGAGDTFYITFDGTNLAKGVGVGYEFTTAVAAVPVPAAGLLLLTALIGGGAAARVRKKNA